jgi:hypothetical protein
MLVSGYLRACKALILRPPNMALQRTRALAFARVRSPLNAQPLAGYLK